jgi:transposase InsO family protein
MVSPVRRRDAAIYLQRRHHVPERRVCRIVGQHRSTQRYRPSRLDLEVRLARRMNELAERHPRYGYRRVWALLRQERWRINRKRIERLWRTEGHRVPPRRSKESGRRVRELERLFERHGTPTMIRPDNGREFIAATVIDGLAARGVVPIFIEKGSPQQNPFVERFNGTMCDELLNGEEFESLLEARVVIQRWLHEYNEQRPHRGLGMLTPAAFAAEWKVGS